MSTDGESEEGPGTLVSRVLDQLADTGLSSSSPQQSPTDTEDILDTIPSDAGRRPTGDFDRRLFQFETGILPSEYVIAFLEANGSRARQQTIVGSLEWSASTVSRLLASMEDDGAIETVPVGREKIVCLPGSLPSDEIRS